MAAKKKRLTYKEWLQTPEGIRVQMKVPRDGKIPSWQAWIIGTLFLLTLFAACTLPFIASYVCFSMSKGTVADQVFGTFFAFLGVILCYNISVGLIRAFKNEQRATIKH